MTETREQQIERLKDNDEHRLLGDMPVDDQTLLRSLAPKYEVEILATTDGSLCWVLNGEDKLYLHHSYRIRSDYHEEPKWSNRVFASTCDMEKDAANNVVGVTAHCKCGHVFADDVVHGKHKEEHHEEPEPDDCEVFYIGDTLHFKTPDGKVDYIGNAVDYKGFRGWYDGQQRILTDHVAEHKNMVGHKVVARFRR